MRLHSTRKMAAQTPVGSLPGFRVQEQARMSAPLIDKRRIKAGPAINQWLAYCEMQVAAKQLSANKLRRYKSIVRWKPYLGKRAVGRITKKVLADFIAWRFANASKAPPSHRSIALDYQNIRVWLRWCVDQGMRPAVPEFIVAIASGHRPNIM
jgi:hypothetical protein